MMEYIKGVLTEASPLKTVVETGGIGYRLLIPLNNFAKLPKVGELVCLFLATVIREDSHKTYGFLTTKERDLFETLIDISGIGPKTALSLLGHLEPDDLQMAISRCDISSICKVPGIGKKTAERLVVEMKDRVQKHPSFPFPSSPTRHEKNVAQDVLSALVNLGYSQQQAQKATQTVLEQHPEETDLAFLITTSLKKL